MLLPTNDDTWETKGIKKDSKEEKDEIIDETTLQVF